MQIRTRLRAAREVANLTQREMADHIGISDSLLRSLETGRLQPGDRTAQLLFATFGEPAHRLLKAAKTEALPQIRPVDASEETP